jgi:hypothetical protein
MIQEIIGLVKDKSEQGEQQFYMLTFKYANQGAGYFATTLFGTEEHLRSVLKTGGIADAAINQLFANAN